MPLFSYPEKVIYSSEANPSQDPVLSGSGLSFSLISCQHSPNPCTQPLGCACFHTSMHLITHVTCYACSVLLPPLLLSELHSRPQYMSLDYLTLGRSHRHLQVAFPQALGTSIVFGRYIYHKTYYIIHLLII